MNVAPLLRQQVQWEPLASTDNRGDPTFGPAQTVPARAVAKLKDIIAKDGETITTTTSVMMVVEPGIGDLLDGREVVAVTTQVDYRGVISAWTALTR